MVSFALDRLAIVVMAAKAGRDAVATASPLAPNLKTATPSQQRPGLCLVAVSGTLRARDELTAKLIISRAHLPSSKSLKNSLGSRTISVLTALGVVYGDIGTSPLYVYPALHKAVGKLDSTDALGSLSLILWTLIVIVSVKYALFVMRADNRGEGGILALMSLTQAKWRGKNRYLLVIGLVGAALLYGDGIITPAISVLSAVEGLKIASTGFEPYTTYIAAVILLALFAAQRFGTAKLGGAFGPLMTVWFVSIAGLGIAGIWQNPKVLAAVSPTYAMTFLGHHELGSFAILGAVFLCATGSEAMYADLGHMGRAPIRIAWFSLVLPALFLNYAGQTALLIGPGESADNPFFALVPQILLYPVVGLATIATVIASQAIITGAYSMTRQAMQLGWMPGINIVQTSEDERGQLYVPFVNWTMMMLTLTLTLAFQSSDRLAGAYGVAVSTTSLMTTALLYRVMRVTWRWSIAAAALVFLFFFAIDLAFFAGNALKIAEGGWIPLLVGAAIFPIMTTWHDGMDALDREQDQDRITLAHFVRQLRDKKIPRQEGVALFLTRLQGIVPPVIADHVRQLGALYQEVAALTVRFSENRPRIDPKQRIVMRHLGPGFWHLTLSFGFIEVPDVTRALRTANSECPFDMNGALYFSERDRIERRRTKPRMAAWRRALFSFLYRNSIHPADRFNLPAPNFIQITRARQL
jgi:KUP system potassium uptake protein